MTQDPEIGWPHDIQTRHPGTRHFVDLFVTQHLVEPFRTIALHAAQLAAVMVHELEDGPELTAGLRKLLEAKDCFVRQVAISSSKNKEEPR